MEYLCDGEADCDDRANPINGSSDEDSQICGEGLIFWFLLKKKLIIQYTVIPINY